MNSDESINESVTNVTKMTKVTKVRDGGVIKYQLLKLNHPKKKRNETDTANKTSLNKYGH